MAKTLLWLAMVTFCGLAFGANKDRYGNPFEELLTISGSVEPQLTAFHHFTIHVGYGATSNAKSCLKGNWFEGAYWHRGLDDAYAIPSDAGKFELRLPLKTFDPKAECGWKPSNVSLCTETKRSKDCLNMLELASEPQNDIRTIAVRCAGYRCFQDPPIPKASPATAGRLEIRITGTIPASGESGKR